MNDKPVFDPDRDRAIRAMIVENARAEKARPSLRARASLLIGLVIAALLLSGGGVAMALTGIIQIPVAAPAPVETPSATPTPTPTSTPTTAPAPPPAPEPTPTAVDVSSWIIGFDGVGPIVFGGSIAEASAALDTTDLVPFDFGVDECPADYRQLPGNPRSFIGVDPRNDDVIDYLEVTNYVSDEGEQLEGALPRTSTGISTGSTSAELLAAYPDLVEEPLIAGDTVYSLTGPDERRLWFRIASATDTIQVISLSDTPFYTLGGCGP